MMPMTLSNPDSNTINALREMMRQGLLSEDDLANLKVSNTIPEQGQSNNAPLGMFNAPNQLAPIIQPGLNQWDKLQSGEGVIQSSNGDGSLNIPIRINKVPPPTWNPQAQGNAPAGIVQRPMGTEQTAAGAERDMSRPEVQLFGKAPGYYGKDGKIYHKDGTVTTILPEGSLANFHAQQKQQMDMQKFTNEQANTQARTQHTQAETTKANMENALLAQNGGKKLMPGEMIGPNGQVQLSPNAPQFAKLKDAHAKDYGTMLGIQDKTNAAINKIDDILDPEKTGDPSQQGKSTGFQRNFGGWNAAVSRQFPDALDFKNRIEGLKSDMKAAGLELMRSGGSIGQMTEREWPIVEGMLAKIDYTMTEPEAVKQFNAIKTRMMNLQDKANAVYETEWAGTQFAKNRAEPKTSQANANSGNSSISGSFPVTLPDGRTKNFPNAAAAAMFKKAAGL